MARNDLEALFTAQNERDIKQLLEREGKRLLAVAQAEWRKYEDSYQPTQYVRTGRSLNSMTLGPLERLPDGQWGIRLIFRDDLAWHDSVLWGKSDQPKGHAIWLISEGWHSKRLEKRIGYVPRFTRYEGYGYLDNVLNRFKKGMPSVLDIELNWQGAVVKK